MAETNDEASYSIPSGISPQELEKALQHWLEPSAGGKVLKPCVVSISGDWGTGKTYWWNNSFSKTLQTKSIYVSLFGVQSLQVLEQRLLSATVGVYGEVDESRVKKGLEALGKMAKIGAESLAGSTSAVGNIVGALSEYVGEVVRDAAYSRLAGQVVVLDDLERRAQGLKIEEILGFVSRLR